MYFAWYKRVHNKDAYIHLHIEKMFQRVVLHYGFDSTMGSILKLRSILRVGSFFEGAFWGRVPDREFLFKKIVWVPPSNVIFAECERGEKTWEVSTG